MKDPYIEVAVRKCTLCELTSIPCARIGRAWACYFCLRQALNMMVQAPILKEKVNAR